MHFRFLTATVFGLAIGLFGGIEGGPDAGTSGVSLLSFEFGIPTAQAGRAQARRGTRRVSRRTSRRTSRRVARRHSIAGCGLYMTYYNCGGVYYQPYVENGVTVYIVVTP